MFFLYASFVTALATLTLLLINQPPLNDTFRAIVLVALGAALHHLYRHVVTRIENCRLQAEQDAARAWQNGDFDKQGWGWGGAQDIPEGQGWGNDNNNQNWQGWGNDTTKAGWDNPDEYDCKLLAKYLLKQLAKGQKELYESDEI